MALQTLAELRARFVEITGRYDLQDPDDGSDNGANLYIQQASQKLYEKYDILPNKAFMAYTIPAGANLVPTPNLITPRQCYYKNSDGNKTEIGIVDRDTFETSWPDVLRGAVYEGEVSFDSDEITADGINFLAYGFYVGMTLRVSGTEDNNDDFTITAVETGKITVSQTFTTEASVTCKMAGYENTPGNPEYARPIGLGIAGYQPVYDGNIGLLFDTPFSTETLLYIEGYYEVPLVEETDKNYWTINHPLIIIFMAAYLLEITYRNTAGANDWMSALNEQLGDLEMRYEFYNNVNVIQMREGY